MARIKVYLVKRGHNIRYVYYTDIGEKYKGKTRDVYLAVAIGGFGGLRFVFESAIIVFGQVCYYVH